MSSVRLSARSAVLAASTAALALLGGALAPVATAAPVEGAGIAPQTQTIKSGGTAHWSGAVYGGKAAYRVTFSYGDGSSRTFTSNATVWDFSHTYSFCTARSKTFTQKLTVTDGYGVTSTDTSKVTATYSGPICE